MANRSFDVRISKLHAKRQSKTSQVERDALTVIITYLDELSARKVAGDLTVQGEIVAVNNYLRSL